MSRCRTRKSSACVTLVLIGAAALSSCGGENRDEAAAPRRDLYASKEDCLADWGDPGECEERDLRARNGSHRSVFIGGSRGSGAGISRGSSSGRSSGSSGSSSRNTARGGFGSSGRSSGS
jgi:hypothetical protein